MQVSQAVKSLNKTVFQYVEPNLPLPSDQEYQTFTLTEEQFFVVLPRISCCGFRPSLEETVNYILEREVELVRLYSSYNGNPYCPTWWVSSAYNDEITFGYETSSGTLIEMTISDKDEPLYQIEIPCSRAGGFHDLLVGMAKAGATPELFEIKHNFWCVTEEDYQVYMTWWNSTNLGKKLPSWEDHCLELAQHKKEREEKYLAEVEQQKAARTWHDEDFDNCDYEEVDDIE